MASFGSSHLKDIDEKFCQCRICLQQYIEPKLLPCLHRYCSYCLKQLIERNQGVTVVSCPECRDEAVIPPEGVDGFKTDFHMKNIIEYIEIQKSLVDEQLRECYNCKNKLKVIAYCFKCIGFLCKECHKMHVTGESLKDHKTQTVFLREIEARHMTLEKLSDLKNAPKCQSHPNVLCELCCRTCSKLPICLTCVHGIHKSHDIIDVQIIAAEEREKLQNEMEKLKKHPNRILKMPQRVDIVREYICSNFEGRKRKFTTKGKKDIQTVKEEIERIEEDYRCIQTETENNKEKELREKRKQMDEEMKQIKIKYDNMFEEIEKKSKVKLDNFRKEKEEKIRKSREQLAILGRRVKHSTDTFEKDKEKELSKLEDVSQQIGGIIRRYENLMATGCSVLNTRDDWTAVQCIPDICKAMEPLAKDMRKEFPDLENLLRVGVSFEVKEDKESPVDIKNIKRDKWNISSITAFGDGSVVITGRTSTEYQSHITLITINGKVLWQKQLEGKHQFAFRYCAYLSEFKLATACWHDEIGVFDIRDYSYIKTNIRDVISSWSDGRSVRYITTDSVNNHIWVGSYDDNHVYVFNDKLKHLRTLTLQENIKSPRDMAFKKGKLLVCNLLNNTAYAVFEREQCLKVARELRKPDCGGDDWAPLSVCTDSYGFIYILWMTGTSLEAGRRVIVQYTKDGEEPLTQIQINSTDAWCITTVNTAKGRKLLVATSNSGKLHIYSVM